RLPPERRVLARARAPSSRRPALALLPARRGRRRARGTRAHRAAARGARRLDRTPRAAPARQRRDAARRHPRGPRGLNRGRPGPDRAPAGDAVAARRPAGHLVARRHRDGLDMIPLVERYRDRLPIAQGDPIVSLCEGSTPLVRANALSKELGADLWLKLESMNPTGSFK